jgi:3'(2'), 5'-bisphosphate nucleotidase
MSDFSHEKSAWLPSEEHQNQWNEISELALKAAQTAGMFLKEAFLSVKSLPVEWKGDQTPVTQADKTAHKLIADILSKSEIPVVSEEDSVAYPSEGLFWLIDPLDGTKDFIQGSPEFCVNIALIDTDSPIFGVMCAPVEQIIVLGDVKHGRVSVIDFEGNEKSFQSKNSPNEIAAISRFHVERDIQDRIQKHQWAVLTRGSALKCLDVLFGAATFYPRFAPLSGWDIAAGDAILRASGGGFFSISTGELVRYGIDFPKAEPFIAVKSAQKAIEIRSRYFS